MSSSTLAAGIRHLRGKLAAQQRYEDSDEQLLHAFLTSRDDSAFAVLVRRHGPMVLHVCRRVLGHQHDAEDAFQATFLVLARNAVALRNKSTLASYLHGIAYRTALKARQSAARRRKHECSLGALTQPRSPADPADELSWREVRALLDEEIANLPEIYRSVFVLCCLENASREEAARRLGLKAGTVSSRLTAARKRLSQKLAHRGVELSVLLAAATMSAVSPALMANTMKAVLANASGTELARVVSASVAELIESAASAVMSKTKIATLMVLTVSLLGGVGVYFLASPQCQQGQSLPALRAGEGHADAPRPGKRNEAKTVEIQGRVVDPDGKPVGGAKLLFIYASGRKYPHKVWAVSGDQGRFAFTVPVKDVDNGYLDKPWEDTHVMATAEGYGFAAARVGKPGVAGLTLQLVKDDVPIRGRILNPEGKPIAGVRVRIGDRLILSKESDLTSWLAELKADGALLNGNADWGRVTELSCSPLDLLFPPVTTGTDGRFEMKGIGRERIAHLRIEGPAIATEEIRVMTRASEVIRLWLQKDHPKGQHVTYYGAGFDHVAMPSRPVLGVVRGKDTGKPLAGVRIESVKITDAFHISFLWTTTDKDGRYRLDGLPKSDGNVIAATTSGSSRFAAPTAAGTGENKIAAMNEQPYLPAVENVENTSGLEPVRIDFALQRGIWVKGRITDKSTSKPLRADVNYFCFVDNPRVNDISRLGVGVGIYLRRSSLEDGVFQIPILPGHGLIAVRAYQNHYVLGAGAEKIKGSRPDGRPDLFVTNPLCLIRDFHTLVEIDPKPDEESVRCDVALEPGRTLKGIVLDPDGKPLAGASIVGLKELGFWEDNAGSDFRVEGLSPSKPRVLQFVHHDRKLSGYLILRGDEKDPIRVQLKPYGTLTGRVVTPLGRPLSSARVECRAQLQHQGQPLYPTEIITFPDKDGRFRIVGLVAGQKYGLSVSRSNVQQPIAGGNPKALAIEAGSTKDLGDLQVKPIE
jgi:RNA polymerase sigma factor (sigma-70 family)